MASNQNDTIPPSPNDVVPTQSHTVSDSLEDLDSLEDDDPLATTAAIPITSVPPPPPPPFSDESRRLFQRLWTDEDEIELLQGFLDFTTQRSLQGAAHPHHDTAGFYDMIRPKLQFEFNKSQLVEKLRRLKKKYRNVVGRIGGKDFAFKCAHDATTFELSKRIWGSVVKCEENLDDGCNSPNPNGGGVGSSCEEKGGKLKKRVRSGGGCDGDVGRVVEESVKRCVSPMVKELVSGVIGGLGLNGIVSGSSPGFNGIGMNPGFGMNSGLSPFGLMNGGLLNFGVVGRDVVVDERWRNQQILELEVYSKRLELVQEQVKAALEELRSTGGET